MNGKTGFGPPAGAVLRRRATAASGAGRTSVVAQTRPMSKAFDFDLNHLVFRRAGLI